MNNDLLLSILPAMILAVASGMIGVFALMRRMSLAADAMSHIALPGIGLAILWQINPILGGAATLFLGVLIIWKIEGRAQLPVEAIIGVIFSLSLAIGSLLATKEDLIDALFGGFGSFSWESFLIIAGLSVFIIISVLFFKNRWILQMTSPDLAAVAGLKNSYLNLSFFLLFALAIVLGLKFLGALLAGSLIIIPAAAAKNLGWNMNSMLVLAAVLATISVIGGFFIADYYSLLAGPVIIILASVIFFVSLVFKRA